MTKLEKATEQHKTLVKAVAKAIDNRDNALRVLVKAVGRYNDAIKAVARSSKRLDKLRAEDRAAKKSVKSAQHAEQLPPIAV